MKGVGCAVRVCETTAYNTITNLQVQSKVVTRCHALSRVVTRCHALSRVVTRCHALSRVVTRCHLMYLWSAVRLASLAVSGAAPCFNNRLTHALSHVLTARCIGVSPCLSVERTYIKLLMRKSITAKTNP